MMELAKSPTDKMKRLCSVVVGLSCAYTLSFSQAKKKYASAEFLIPAMIMILLRVKQSNPLATLKYIREFAGSSRSFDFEEQQKVLYASCNQYLLELKVS